MNMYHFKMKINIYSLVGKICSPFPRRFLLQNRETANTQHYPVFYIFLSVSKIHLKAQNHQYTLYLITKTENTFSVLESNRGGEQ